MTNPLSLLVAGAIEHFLPGTCLLCGAASAGHTLCPACHGTLPRMPATRCPRCSLPTTHGEHCGACQKNPPEFASVDACYRYEFPTDRLIQALKYGHQTILAKDLATELLSCLAGRTFDCIVPMPLHPARLAERGFNQAAELARHLAKARHCRLDRHGLVRERHGEIQALLPLKSRHANVRGAFACRRDLSGEHVLLVDDVMTSGASLGECSRILRLHGAASVRCAVIARALPH